MHASLLMFSSSVASIKLLIDDMDLTDSDGCGTVEAAKVRDRGAT